MRSWKPANYPSVSPYLICAEAERTLRFLGEAFGGVVLRRYDRPDGSLMHAEVQIDDSIVMIGGGATGERSAAPHIHLYVPDALSAFRRAVAAGATPVQEPCQRQADDDLRGGVRDAWGTTWWIATRLPPG